MEFFWKQPAELPYVDLRLWQKQQADPGGTLREVERGDNDEAGHHGLGGAARNLYALAGRIPTGRGRSGLINYLLYPACTWHALRNTTREQYAQKCDKR